LSMVSIGARYISEETQKKYIRDAFGHYISPVVVDNIIKAPGGLKLEGEKKDLTILFSDIRGFTGISEGMDPQLLAKLLNDYMTLLTEIIVEKHAGTLDKYIGDAIMAFWGAPLDQKNKAVLACKASIEMHRALDKAENMFKAKYGSRIHMGVGLHSGETIVGNMGSQKQFNYTAIGDSVNLASRLESLTKYYGVRIIISGSTFKELGDETKHFYTRKLDIVRVRGKTEAADIYQVFINPVASSALEVFSDAREKFISRKWDEAIKSFKEARQDFSQVGYEDKASMAYIEKSELFKKNPPPETWDGSLEMRVE